MRKICFFFFLVFIKSLIAQNPWSYDVTDVSHNILIPGNAVNANFLVGDIIGVFYQDDDNYNCVGYSEWTGENLVLTAFGASFNFDGFIPNQEIFLFHWDHQNQQIRELYPVFNTIDFSQQEIFVVDGLSGVSYFQIEYIPGCTDSDYLEYNENALQDDGSCEILWREAYFNTLATLQLTIDSLRQEEIRSDSIQLEFDNLMIQYNDLQSNYNSLSTEYDNFKIQSQITIDSLSLIISILREPILIDLYEGWNIMGYNLKYEQNISTTMVEISDDIHLIKNNYGEIYWPEFVFDGIGNLIPGHGYQIRMYNTVEDFHFPNFHNY